MDIINDKSRNRKIDQAQTVPMNSLEGTIEGVQ